MSFEIYMKWKLDYFIFIRYIQFFLDSFFFVVDRIQANQGNICSTLTIQKNALALKDTLMQIWKSPYIFVFIRKKYAENFAFLFLRILELYNRKVCEMFVYKHTETTEYVKN